MKEMLQFLPERIIGDCFLMEEGIVIRVSGLFHQPYILPAFLTPMIFSLEMIRKKLIVENEHFINFKKSSEIKFPWVVGPFIIKSKDALPIIESFLKEMGFQTTTSINYHPHHIISISKQVNKNKPFQHEEVDGLTASEN